MIDLNFLGIDAKSILDKFGDEIIAFIPKIILAIVIIVFFIFLSRAVKNGIVRVLKKARLPENIKQLMGIIAKITVVVIGVMAALGVLNLSQAVASLLAGVGIVGLALGFAFKNIAANFISGIILAFNSHVEVGDVVEIEGHRGKIISTDLRSITIKKADDSIVMIPNKTMFENVVVNHSDKDFRRVEISLGIGYDSDLDKVVRVVKSAVEKTSNLNEEREVVFEYKDFGGSSIDFEVRFWITSNEYGEYLKAKNEAFVNIKKALDNAGIDIPYQTITVKNAD